MNKSNKYSPDIKERAVRMVQEARKDSRKCLYALPTMWKFTSYVTAPFARICAFFRSPFSFMARRREDWKIDARSHQ